jgi:TRAP-type uncharacterized transport system substrate-binding protein
MDRPSPLSRVHAPTIRSRLVLEMAAEMVADGYPAFRETRVELRGDTPIALDSSSTMAGIDAVVSGRSALAMVNPAAFLTLAYRGAGPWTAPQPVRALCVIPSRDIYACAVTPQAGLSRFEDIAARHYPLRISVRAQRDHSLHMVLDHLMAAAGFTLADLESWGGGLRYDSAPRKPKSAALAAGANAYFDEAIQSWLRQSIGDGMTILSIAEPTMRKLEAMGYRRAIIEKAKYPDLPADVVSLDFSGWTVFVHADAADEVVMRMCAALEARKAMIPWGGEGPLPLERMCRDTPETPLDVPLHPAAGRFWKERGYIG